MIKFKRLNIYNYKSIKEAKLTYDKGIWLVEGNNKDSSFASNGAGKSTVLEALQQCLFNKNSKSIGIEDTYNRITQVGYTLEIQFEANAKEYLVANDRTSNTITVIEDSKDISKKTIPDSLKLIQSIIGFDFNTFCALTYISHSNIVQLLESFSSSNIMKVLLDFDAISTFETKVKDANTYIKSVISFMLTENAQLEDKARLMSNFEYTDLTNLYKHKQKLSDEFLKQTVELNIDNCNAQINSLMSEIISIDKELEQLEFELHGQKCPTCGQATVKLGLVGEGVIEFSIKGLQTKRLKAENTLEELVAYTNEMTDKLIVLRAEFDTAIEQIDSQLAIGEYKNKLYHEHKDLIDNTQQKIAENKIKLSEAYFNQDLYEVILKTIKSGKLHKELIDNFTKVLNTYIDEYTKYMSISYLNIKSKASKTNIEFLVYDSRASQFIELNTLSGGELTRLRIIVLMSMLKAITTLTTLSTNILVLDEALDTLDASAANDLSALFQHLIETEDKFIALVSHGAQLNEIDFNGKITAIKENGLTQIEQQEI